METIGFINTMIEKYLKQRTFYKKTKTFYKKVIIIKIFGVQIYKSTFDDTYHTQPLNNNTIDYKQIKNN